VGIALALLGNFLIVVAATASGVAGTLLVAELIARGAQLPAPWLQAAFAFLLVGYGTKMGLAPMHTWLPDAHSEAPSPSPRCCRARCSNCAFLGILRAHAICAAAGLGAFSGNLLAGFGLVSMFVAAAFIVGQTDYKRMLAYSSVEHMGLLAFGAGLGGAAIYGALLHAANHSAVKAALFLLAGISSPRIDQIHRPVGGGLRRLRSAAAVAGGTFRHHRFAAVRHVRQRIHDAAGGIRARGGAWAIAALVALAIALRAWRRRFSACRWARPGRFRGGRRRTLADRVAGARAVVPFAPSGTLDPHGFAALLGRRPN
jgi:hypothetical protein